MIAKIFFQTGIQMRRCAWLVATLSALLLTAALGAEDNALTDKLPRGYIGEFRWDGDKIAQNIAIKFEQVRALDAENAEAIGCGVYEVAGQMTTIRVRMLVRWSTLQIEIREQVSEGVTFFETDGSHRGHLSEEFQQIDARWTTRITGQQGELHLRASPAVVCAPAPSA